MWQTHSSILDQVQCSLFSHDDDYLLGTHETPDACPMQEELISNPEFGVGKHLHSTPSR